ncbi:KH domain-containing protein [Candidatus Gottesmanbacteria bacterium]|nr:KH domain-containing protein [Candidatus Gottesmanbacteria bacterium]
MKDFLTWLIKAIVDNPEKVTVSETEENGQIILKLSVAAEDMGKVIGKGGKIIKSIRHLARVRGAKEEKRVNVVLLEQ